MPRGNLSPEASRGLSTSSRLTARQIREALADKEAPTLDDLYSKLRAIEHEEEAEEQAAETANSARARTSSPRRKAASPSSKKAPSARTRRATSLPDGQRPVFPIPLVNRAVHPFFLEYVLNSELPAACSLSPSSRAAEVVSPQKATTAQVVQVLVQPATLHADADYVTALAHGDAQRFANSSSSRGEAAKVHLGPSTWGGMVQQQQQQDGGSGVAPGSCSGGASGAGGLALPSVPGSPRKGPGPGAVSGRPGAGESLDRRPFHGPATFFVSHVWSQEFRELVEAVREHYRLLPGAVDSHGVLQYMPVYYWIDVFAVNHNFVGSLAQHPDNAFLQVIATCSATLLLAQPWDAPLAFSRLWCMAEVLLTVRLNKRLVLLLRGGNQQHARWGAAAVLWGLEAGGAGALEQCHARLAAVCQRVELLGGSEGAAGCAVSVESDRATLLGQLSEAYGWAEPLSLSSRLRQVLEGCYCGLLADVALHLDEFVVARGLVAQAAAALGPSLSPPQHGSFTSLHYCCDDALRCYALLLRLPGCQLEHLEASPGEKPTPVQRQQQLQERYTEKAQPKAPSPLPSRRGLSSTVQQLPPLPSPGGSVMLSSSSGPASPPDSSSWLQQVTPEGAAELAAGLASNRTLTVLHLDGNRIGSAGFAALAGALQRNRTLKHLTVTNDQLDSSCGPSLAGLLQGSARLGLLRLDLSGNPRLGAAVEQLAAALLPPPLLPRAPPPPPKHLQVLQLGSVGMGAPGALALAAVVAHPCCSLRVLDVSDNRLEGEGAAGMARALAVNTSLLQLNMDLCRIGQRGVKLAIQAVLSNPRSRLELLLLWGNLHGLTSDKANAVRQQLSNMARELEAQRGTISVHI